MRKILTQTKHIVILILLFTIVPELFVKGFFAYIYHVADEELLNMLKQTHNTYYKICMDAAYLSLFLTYAASYFILKKNNLRLWLKFLFIFLVFIVLFHLLVFLITDVLSLHA